MPSKSVPSKSVSKKASTSVEIAAVKPSASIAQDDATNPLDSEPKKGQLLGFELDRPQKCAWLFDRPRENIACTVKGEQPMNPAASEFDTMIRHSLGVVNQNLFAQDVHSSFGMCS